MLFSLLQSGFKHFQATNVTVPREEKTCVCHAQAGYTQLNLHSYINAILDRLFSSCRVQLQPDLVSVLCPHPSPVLLQLESPECPSQCAQHTLSLLFSVIA